MMRLVKAGLMFGNLYEVSSPALVEPLTEFHIDIVGASPEIAHELDDELYLNPHGANQMFILLSTDQKTAPLLNSQFSTSRSILRQYIEENENQIDRFTTDDDAWWDDVLIAEMIELAKRTGNIQRNPVKLDSKIYTQGNYFTSHFGGVYVFRDTNVPTIVAREKIEGLDDADVDQVLTFDDREGIANWLRDEGLSQLIVQRPSQDSALIIRQKMDFIVVATAANHDHDLAGLSRQNMRTQHKDRDLVNMLLTDLSRLDFRQLFICHKSLFYDAYQSWSDQKKDFVVRFLNQEYAMDKSGAREALFGTEPSMREEVSRPEAASRGQSMTRIVENDLLEVDIETGRTRKAVNAYVSPWGLPEKSRDKSRGKKGKRRR